MTSSAQPVCLSAAELLKIWEQGAAWHPIDQALLIVQTAYPDLILQDLREMAIGRRDTLLLQIRRYTFGDRIEAYVECSNCRGGLEMTFSCETLLEEVPESAVTRSTVEYDGVAWELRAPNSLDMAAVAVVQDIGLAKETLFVRCAQRREACSDNPGPLPPALQDIVERELAVLDPQAEILIDLTCQVCGHRWQTVFDIVAFLWREIHTKARRLLQEVDVLARTYGWTETEVLDLSEARRRLYVHMALS
jgi:hypothetical protein